MPPTNSPWQKPLLGLTVFVLAISGITVGATTTPAKAAIVSCAPGAEYNNCVQYTYSGGNQTFTVPKGVTEIRATLDGGGESRIGTRGGRTVGTVAVTPGATINVTVGQGGGGAGTEYTFGGGAPGGRTNCAYCGQQGGGMSALWNGTPFTANAALLIAGGAGGDGSGSRAGGAGGGVNGNNGTGPNVAITGKGGTQDAGGAAGTGGRLLTDGTQFRGGTGGRGMSGNNGAGGGGGGGGWFGGGGGGWSNTTNTNAGGGGGAGSGYIDGVGVGDASTTVGGGSSSTNGVVTIQFLAPAATLDPVATPTTEPVQQLSGTGVPGNDVVVTLQPTGDVLCETTIAPDGTWSCDTASIPDGAHEVEVSQADPARPDVTYGTVTAPIVVDTIAPGKPVIENPAEGTVTNNPLPAFGGTGEVGALITVRDETNAVICTATVEDDGSWSCDPSTPFVDSNRTFTATQVDAAGNESPASDPINVTFLIALPDPPVIEAPINGAVFQERSPVISGTGTFGDTVTVTDSTGATICDVAVESDGTWECTPAVSLADGKYSISAIQTDVVGDSSAQSAVVVFTVDNLAPAAPTIVQPTDGLVTNDATPTFSGLGEPGATVTVIDETGAVVCTAIVVSNPIASGTWSCESTISFADGNKTFAASQSDRAGNTSAESAPVDVTILVAIPEAPVIESPEDALVTNEPNVTVAGTGTAGFLVTVRDTDGSTLCTVTVEADSTWACAPASGFAEGTHTVTAVQTDPTGDASPVSNEVAVTVDTTAPLAPVVTKPADGGTAEGPRPEFAGSGEPGTSIVVVDGNGDELCSTTVAADGSWSCVTSRDLSDGSVTATVIATDAAGNSSSTEVGFTLAPPVDPGNAEADANAGSSATANAAGASDAAGTANAAADSTADAVGSSGSGAGSNANGNSSDDDLARTGASAQWGALTVGGSVLIAGLAVILLRRRTQSGASSGV